jgi:transposase-like protein
MPITRNEHYATRDVTAAERFFKKMMRVDHRRLPFTISVDKDGAYLEADDLVLALCVAL